MRCAKDRVKEHKGIFLIPIRHSFYYREQIKNICFNIHVHINTYAYTGPFLLTNSGCTVSLKKPSASAPFRRNKARPTTIAQSSSFPTSIIPHISAVAGARKKRDNLDAYFKSQREK